MTKKRACGPTKLPKRTRTGAALSASRHLTAAAFLAAVASLKKTAVNLLR
jgi:hypothetical protein